MNRVVYQFNDTVDEAVAKPAANMYRHVVPQPIRTAIGNFFDNINDAYSAASNALRADAERTLNDIMRVAVNSTFGIFGLIDIATPIGLKNNKNTLGDTFASWGWKNSAYLVLPLLGASTIRDGSATGLTLYASPDRALYSGPAAANTAWGVYLLNKRQRLLGVDDAITNAALDDYTYTRDAYLQIRAKVIGAPPPATVPDDISIDEIMGKH